MNQKSAFDFAALMALSSMRLVGPRAPLEPYRVKVDQKKKKRRKIATASKRRNRR